MTQNDVKAGVRDLLLTLDGIGSVDVRYGGIATWAANPQPKSAYWVVHITAVSESQGQGLGTLGGRDSADFSVQIEGWMPFSFSQNTDAAWGDLLDAIRDTLRDATIGGFFTDTAEANFTDVPDVTQNDYEAIAGGGNGGDIVCHHAVIEWLVRDYIDFNRR